MEIKPFWMKVTPEQSKIVQETLFDNGYTWYGGRTEVLYTDSKYLSFYGTQDLPHISPNLTYGGTRAESYKPELTFEEFKQKYIMSTQDKIKQLEEELNKLKEEVKKKEYPEYYKLTKQINNSNWTVGKIYKCLHPENLEHSCNFIDNQGEANGMAGENYKHFTPSTKEEFDKQEEFKVGDIVVVLSTNSYNWGGSIGNTKPIIGNIYTINRIDITSGIIYLGIRDSYNKIAINLKDVRKATSAEIEAFTNKTKELYFGSTKVTVKQGSSYAETQYGNITKAEIKEIIDFFEQDFTILGHKMQIVNEGKWFIKFGCQKDSISSLKEIYKAFD